MATPAELAVPDPDAPVMFSVLDSAKSLNSYVSSPLGHGARYLFVCMAVASSPVSVVVPFGNFVTVAGMFQIAQCCPIAMFAPIFVSMKVMAKDMVPAGMPVQSSSGLTPDPNVPFMAAQVYMLPNLAPSI